MKQTVLIEEELLFLNLFGSWLSKCDTIQYNLFKQILYYEKDSIMKLLMMASHF